MQFRVEWLLLLFFWFMASLLRLLQRTFLALGERQLRCLLFGHFDWLLTFGSASTRVSE